MTQRFGYGDCLQIEVRWLDGRLEDAHLSTEAAMIATVGDVVVWGKDIGGGDVEPIEWFLVDLLEFLSSRWDWLRFEEAYPLPLAPAPSQPSLLWKEAEARWEAIGTIEADEEEAVFAFAHRHNLAHAFPGGPVPSLWLLRQGNEMLIDIENADLRRGPVDEILAVLEELGEFIAQRLRKCSDPYAEEIVDRWRNREQPLATQARIYSAANEERMALLRPHLERANQDGTFAPNTIFAAARQFGSIVSPEEFEHFAEFVAAFPARSTPRLDAISQSFQTDEAWQSCRPFAQGYWLAEQLRLKLLDDEFILDHRSRLDPRELLNAWNVAIDTLPLDDRLIDAVAIWGPEHGPAVLLNPKGQHAQHDRGQRATLAHEICHLLVDRQKSLPFAEVLNRALSRDIEARANAFAAELLLPRVIAAERSLSAREQERPVTKMVDNLCRSYGVSRELTAWQIRRSHSFDSLPRSWRVALSHMVSNPESFL